MMGKAYPLAGGLLKTTDIADDILEKILSLSKERRKFWK